jgi:NAD(P)-dependent dehydrogenase (short-subunit alcohol dehydrogenase family)
MRLKDRIAVVTGAAGGIGKALSFGACAEGATLICIDRDSESLQALAAELRQTGSIVHTIATDLTDFAAVQSALDHCVELAGRVDVVFSNAGGLREANGHWSSSGGRVAFLEMEPEIWRRVIDDNLTSAFYVGLVFARDMAKRRQGAIVYTGSQLTEVVRPGMCHYTVAKGGLRQLVRAMAVDLATHGIRVNAFAPGPTRVPVNEPFFTSGVMADQTLTQVPLGRMADPSEMVGAAIFLASDEASYVTGEMVMVDGGYTII